MRAAHPAAAEAVRLAVRGAMPPGQGVTIAPDLAGAARQTALDGIRARHPDYDQRTAVRALVRLRYGDDLCRCAWPTLLLPEP